MAYFFNRDDGLKSKLTSIVWGVEQYRRQLFGVIRCSLKKEPTEKEEEILKDWICGQNSDGFGEHFEQLPIGTEEGDLYLSFWKRYCCFGAVKDYAQIATLSVTSIISPESIRPCVLRLLCFTLTVFYAYQEISHFPIELPWLRHSRARAILSFYSLPLSSHFDSSEPPSPGYSVFFSALSPAKGHKNHCQKR